MTEEAKIVSGRAAVSPVIVTGSTDSKSKDAAKKKEESDFPFAVAVLDVYEGPLDLLLDLIRKQDIDIYDIPIAKITAQYLVYVEKIRELDVNIAADFIYMAAVLIHIKSKMLLPRDPMAPAEEQEDPRSELVNRLLELVRLQAIQVRQEKLFGEIAVRKHSHFEEVMNERAAVRDDWR